MCKRFKYLSSNREKHRTRSKGAQNTIIKLHSHILLLKQLELLQRRSEVELAATAVHPEHAAGWNNQGR